MSIPGRLSGVCAAGTGRSAAASAGAMMTLVAKPVVTFAAVCAHFSFWAVRSMRDVHRGNISAKVSWIWQVLPVVDDFTVKTCSASL